MSKLLTVMLLIGLLFIPTACGRTSISSETATPMAAATPTPEGTASVPAGPTPGPTTLVWLNDCTLLSSRDAASFFPTAEVEGPDHQVGSVNQIVFSTTPISATEASCIYYVFNHPGTADMKLLQITYWVDVQGPTTGAAWDRVWTDARSGAAEIVAGIGSDAFYENGRLTFQQGNTYFTIEVVSAGQNFSIAPGSSQQLDLEKKVALDMLANMN